MPLIFNETTSLVCIKFCVAVQSLCGQFCKVKNNFIIFSDFYFMLPMDLFPFFFGGGGGLEWTEYVEGLILGSLDR